MATEITLRAEPRDVVGKKVRRLRREGWVPAVVYGPQVKAQPVQVPRKELLEAYRQAGSSTLIEVVLGDKVRPALIRELQSDPLTQEILHVDLEFVDLNRPITTAVPVVLRGRSPVVDQGLGVLTHGVEEIEIRCLPTQVPAHIEVDLSVLTTPDQAIHVSDLSLPEGVHVLTDPDTVVVYTTSLRRLAEAEERAAKEVEAAPAEAEAAAGEEE